MAANTLTVRGLTAAHRDEAGALAITERGDVTVTLEGMTVPELSEWQWLTDTLNVGIDDDTHRLTMKGWKVVHADAGTLGILFQGCGTRVHIEWYNPELNDYCSAGQQARLRHGVAQILNSRQHYGFPVPVDPQPAAAPAPTDAYPVWHKPGTVVRYHGSLRELHAGPFRVFGCECDDCDGYELRPMDSHWPVALHVSHRSVTPVEAT